MPKLKILHAKTKTQCGQIIFKPRMQFGIGDTMGKGSYSTCDLYNQPACEYVGKTIIISTLQIGTLRSRD